MEDLTPGLLSRKTDPSARRYTHVFFSDGKLPSTATARPSVRVQSLISLPCGYRT